MITPFEFFVQYPFLRVRPRPFIRQEMIHDEAGQQV
jgi:hypothetical protein